MPDDIFGALLEAIRENTAEMRTARGGGGTEAATPSGGGLRRVTPPAGTPAKPTFEAVKAAVFAIKEAHGKPAAIKIITGPGGAPDLASIKPAKYAAVLAACEALGVPGEEDAPADEDSL